jgi:Transposase DDE domain group 1
VKHAILEMVSQRVYGLALGAEDINDDEQLRKDPLFGVLAGRKEWARPWAGKSRLKRRELGHGRQDRYKKITFWKEGIDQLLGSAFVDSHEKPPEQILLDIDTTDLRLHGHQEGRFFHGYDASDGYLPLVVFCGAHVLCARLRQSNSEASAGTLAAIRRISGQIRAAWPEVKIIRRGDSGFWRNEWMSWCEANHVEDVFGLARNQRLRRISGRAMWEATEQWNRTGQPARVFTEFR